MLLISSATIFAPHAVADTTAATISLGSTPYGVGVNPVTNKIYVSNTAGWVSVIDGATNKVVDNIRVGTFPSRIGVNPTTNRIYVGNPGSGSVSVIDGSTNMVVNEIPVGTLPKSVVVNDKTNRIYVANSGSHSISVIDGSTDRVATTIRVGSNPEYIGMNTLTNMIYVSSLYTDTISVIDGSTNRMTNTIGTGICSDVIPRSPSGISVNPFTNKIYVACGYTSTIAIIDGSKNTVVRTVQLAYGSTPHDVLVVPSTNKIYVSNFNAGTVSQIDGASYGVVANLVVGTKPEELAIDPVTTQIYVTNSGSDSVSVIDDPVPIISKVSIAAQDVNGLTVGGLYVTFNSGPTTASGFTPATFSATAGQLYTITVQNYGIYVFDHWADTGARNATRTLVTTSDIQLAAVFIGINHMPIILPAVTLLTPNIMTTDQPVVNIRGFVFIPSQYYNGVIFKQVYQAVHLADFGYNANFGGAVDSQLAQTWVGWLCYQDQPPNAAPNLTPYISWDPTYCAGSSIQVYYLPFSINVQLNDGENVIQIYAAGTKMFPTQLFDTFHANLIVFKVPSCAQNGCTIQSSTQSP